MFELGDFTSATSRTRSSETPGRRQNSLGHFSESRSSAGVHALPAGPTSPPQSQDCSVGKAAAPVRSRISMNDSTQPTDGVYGGRAKLLRAAAPLLAPPSAPGGVPGLLHGVGVGSSRDFGVGEA